jgi:hypothetical protein
MTFEEADKLSSQELHDRAFRHAEHHLNLKFFWDLLEMIPAAKAVEGEIKESEGETLHPTQQVVDAVNEDPALMDALRPVYIDYLVKHPDA